MDATKFSEVAVLAAMGGRMNDAAIQPPSDAELEALGKSCPTGDGDNSEFPDDTSDAQHIDSEWPTIGEQLLGFSDFRFICTWENMDDAGRAKIEPDIRVKCIARYRKLTSYVDKTNDKLRRTAEPLDKTTQTAWPAALDLEGLAQHDPDPPRHIVSDWLPAGEVTLLAGHGGAGESQIALYLAACIGLGLPWCGFDTQKRSVIYVSAEDTVDVLHWRLARISSHLRVPLAEMAGALCIIDASGMDAELMQDIPYGEAALTPMYEALREIVASDCVLILDGTSDFYGASEIVRRHVRRFVRALRRLIGPEGAVLLLAHVDKAAVRDVAASDRYSGSTAWHNSVRARWSLQANDDTGDLTLKLAKSNHARAGAEAGFRWEDGAGLYLPVESAPGGIVAAIADRNEREAILAAMRASTVPVPAAASGQRTAYLVLAERPEFPDSLKGGGRVKTRRFWRQIEQLRQMGAIHEGSYRRTNRHLLAVLEVTNIGSAPNAPNA